jgi:uncharacterized coiled-coil protein SlyX
MIVDINTKVEPKKGELLIFNGKQYEPISQEKLLEHINKQLVELNDNIKVYKQQVAKQTEYIKQLEVKLDGKVKKFINIFRGGKK